MLFSVPKEPFPELISFTFESPSGTVYGRYQAEDGMTFREWSESAYNVDGYKWVDFLESANSDEPPYLVTRDGMYYIDSNSDISLENQFIISGAYYQQLNI